MNLPGGGELEVTGPSEKLREKRRLVVFASLLALVALALVGRLVQLMIVVPARDGEESLLLPEVERGTILDRQGRIMAITTRQQRASAWVPSVDQPVESAGLLSTILGIEKDRVLESFRRHPGYALIKRKLTPEEAAAIRARKDEGKLAGIRLEDDFGRFYPEGKLASHVVGFVGLDNVALAGIEHTFNDELAPQPVGTDAEPVFGDQVILTIDGDIQFIVEKIARRAIEATRADSLMILVMDARTFEILAWSSLPDFDPNEFQQQSPPVSTDSLIDRPLVLAYEPGSVFKIFSIASLLELGTIDADSRFLCTGFYEKRLRSGETIRIKCIAEHGEVTPQRILQYSCNAGAAYASDTTSETSFSAMIERFGFGRVTGLPLLGETPGILRGVAHWSARSKPTIAIGQEISVSAAQVLAAAGALANGGTLLRPRLVRRIVSPGGKVVKEFTRETVGQTVSPGVARKILDMMETATSPAGTARRAAVEGLRISAKTGTAQVASRTTGTYSERDFVASVIGIFPTDDPRLVAYIVIQNPRGESYFGSTIAAPILRDVASALADAMDIPRAGSALVSHPGEISVAVPRRAEIGEVMPDLTGTPKKLLLGLLLRDDIAVTLRGSGVVARQQPPPGTPIGKGTAIVLELE
jgi:cell division protein FtsI (penicillin-binding protein 3)